MIALAGLFLLPELQARRIRIEPGVPSGLEEFSGRQPFLTGIPIPEGELAVGAPVALVDEKGAGVPSQFEVAATWRSDRKHVRWLLVDGLFHLAAGQAAPVYLVYGKDAEAIFGEPAQGIRVETVEGGARIVRPSGAVVLGQGGSGLGELVLVDGSGRRYSSRESVEGPVVEKSGPVRAVVKWTGQFRRADGAPMASYLIRCRYHPDTRMTRVFVTLTWLTDDQTEIASLRFVPDQTGMAEDAVAGLDGVEVPFGPGDAVFRQVGSEEVRGVRGGKRLDGWASTAGHGGLFVGLRWPWQQHPAAFERMDGRLAVALIGPEKPMSLAAKEVAVPGVLHNIASWNLRIFKGGLPGGDVIYNGPDALPHLTPRGISKTWELVVWPEDDGMDSRTKNLLTQRPVLAHADPEFATLAAVPSPMSPYDPKRFPRIEKALKEAFRWFTRELDDEGDFGTWNYGDLQWTWTESGTPIYRYWMNLGKGWSILPWVLWLRSGDREYFENGEANSRHCMDVDTCHVPDWERDPRDFRLRGGQYHYSAVHWGYGPEVFSYYVDSEYLPYAWYCTGLERAKDCLDEHAEAMKRYDVEPILAFFAEDLPGRAGRHLYVMVKNYCALYEATWDEELGRRARRVLDLTLRSQMPNGNFPHVKTNHYLDEPLNIAARVFGWEAVGGAIRNWCGHLGSPLEFGRTGATSGPMSTWSCVSLWRHDKEASWLDLAQRMTNTQAAAVLSSQNEWNGINRIPGHEAGPALRDWPIVMRALLDAGIPPDPSRHLPMQAFGSMLGVSKEREAEGWGSRHLAYTLVDKPGPVTVRFSIADGPKNILVRVVAPDGKTLVREEVDATGGREAYDSRLLQYEFLATKQGAYAIELTTKAKAGPSNSVSMRASTDKLVHVLPEGSRNFFASAYGGQFWFKPEDGAAQVEISNTNGRDVSGRIAIWNAGGDLLGENAVDGSQPWKTADGASSFTASCPAGRACVVKADEFHGGEPCAATVAVDHKWNRWWNLKGMKPYVSRTKEEWFDPSAYPYWPMEKLNE